MSLRNLRLPYVPGLVEKQGAWLGKVTWSDIGPGLGVSARVDEPMFGG